MIECFDLPERLLYKKGNVDDKKSGQAELASLIAKLESSSVLALKILDHIKELFSASYINTLKGRALKSNEDALDSIMCLYIAGLYQLNVSSVTFGDADQGHIWVPQVKCI